LDSPQRTQRTQSEEGDALNAISERIIGAAIAVHRALGPGLLESAYEACLAYEMTQGGLRFERQRPLPVRYRDVLVDCAYRLDFVVEERIVVELKAIEALAPIHQAQVLSYLKLSECPLGLLINFNVTVLRDGVRRIVNRFPDPSASSALSAVKLR
jgi:GxxExxY protein